VRARVRVEAKTTHVERESHTFRELEHGGRKHLQPSPCEFVAHRSKVQRVELVADRN